MYVNIFEIFSRRCHWGRLIEPVIQSIKKDKSIRPKGHYFRHVSVYKVIKKCFYDGVSYSGLLSFWILSVVWHSKEHNFSKTDLFPFLGKRVGKI
jgi:hypothetical protein